MAKGKRGRKDEGSGRASKRVKSISGKAVEAAKVAAVMEKRAAEVAARVAAAEEVGMVGSYAGEALPLATESVVDGVMALDGCDVAYKAGGRTSRFIFALPLHLMRLEGTSSALRGTLTQLDTMHPRLSIPMADATRGKGVLELRGSIVRSSDARFLMLSAGPAGTVATSKVYDSVVLFSTAQWRPLAAVASAPGGDDDAGEAGDDETQPGPSPEDALQPVNLDSLPKEKNPVWPHVSGRWQPPGSSEAGEAKPGDESGPAGGEGNGLPSAAAVASQSSQAFPVVDLTGLIPASPGKSPARSGASAGKASSGGSRRAIKLDSDSDSDVLFSSSGGCESPTRTRSPVRSQPSRSSARKKPVSYAEYEWDESGDDESSVVGASGAGSESDFAP
ncbi:uncharacterized protein AMSG_01630 [Thecamonas trahens ATCC 50062]|uniref:Uncharacterized protein n=1 Tax=Thecamonas trahens ATCC 50062 TaxID=461836 RepID=A0A0L0DTI9_THETB|nr:hypothetical protein AMSG_01630 [Thecamonas trahens ATCC 50062]KNC54778.1 hypothetical protein AMSG_01630 [Thecamonas trahens ATCC 50062]|eukprot:XP_013761678.1 hypothetical protein AMSG_01630 [Thecamonas trahens ATCC 50062]